MPKVLSLPVLPNQSTNGTNYGKDVPLPLPAVHSFCMRTLIFEDIICLEKDTPVNLFFLKKGIPKVFKEFCRKYKAAHAAADQGLPDVGTIWNTTLHQVHGKVLHNPERRHIGLLDFGKLRSEHLHPTVGRQLKSNEG